MGEEERIEAKVRGASMAMTPINQPIHLHEPRSPLL